MTTPATIVEVLGLPGSGKSTVVDQLAGGGTRTMTTWVGSRRLPRVPVAVELFLRTPVLSTLAYLTVATRRGARPVHLRRVLSVQRRCALVRAQRSEGLLALDEGPVHALFVTLYGTRATPLSRLLLRRLVQLLALQVDRYVHLAVPKECCIENFRRPGRTSARFNASSSPAVLQEFREDETYDELLAALRLVAEERLVVVGSVAAACETVRGTPVRSSRPGRRPRG